MQLTDSQLTKIKSLMLAQTQPAYFIMNNEMILVEWSDNLAEYGYQGMEKGIDADEVFDFLVGFEVSASIDLPIVPSPNKTHCSVSILLEEDIIYVLIMDATKDYDQQFLLQQKANEASLLNNKQGKLMAQLIAAQSELEQKNKELEEAYNLVKRFLSGVSHEFRTPLTSIIGYTDALIKITSSDKFELDQASKSICENKLRIVSNNSNYLLSLVENLLDHGRLTEQEIVLHPKRIEIGDFFSSLHAMLFPIADAKNIDFLLTLNAVGDFYFDDMRIRQCVINLVNNAIKFTEKGMVALIVSHKNDELSVTVKDTGIGMNAEEKAKMFDSFWQSNNHKEVGAGLGMTITKRILEGMAGEINVDSVLGEGTEITFSIPAYPCEADAENVANDWQEKLSINNQLEVNESSHVKQTKAPKSSKKILLVEDDIDISDLIEFYLESWGYDSVICQNGQMALDWLSENKADIIFLDLNMPILNGQETLQACREQGITTPIYIMTAQPLGNDSELDEQLNRQADGHILKPINFRELKTLFTNI